MTAAIEPVEYAIPPGDLDPEETARLNELETTIKAGLQTFLEVGRALAEIRDSKLYRFGYSTFADYCREEHGLSRSVAYDHIAAASVVSAITDATPQLPPPSNVGQTRALAAVPSEKQAEVWAQAVEMTGGKPTAKAVLHASDKLGVSPTAARKAKAAADPLRRAVYERRIAQDQERLAAKRARADAARVAADAEHERLLANGVEILRAATDHPDREADWPEEGGGAYRHAIPPILAEAVRAYCALSRDSDSDSEVWDVLFGDVLASWIPLGSADVGERLAAVVAAIDPSAWRYVVDAREAAIVRALAGSL